MKCVPPALHPFLPANPLPIVLIGAGGIVRAAHLPAYQKSNFPVTGMYDLNLDRAKALAAEFGIPRVYASLEEATEKAPPGAIFDVAGLLRRYQQSLLRSQPVVRACFRSQWAKTLIRPVKSEIFAGKNISLQQ